MNSDLSRNDETGLVVPAPAEGSALGLPIRQALTAEELIARAIERQVPVETMERLLAMRQTLKAEAAREAFFEALSAFQGDCPVIEKGKTARIDTRTGGSFSYRYAPLEDIMRAIMPTLRRYGLSVRFDAAFESGQQSAQVVTCIVHHRDGHSERSEFRSPVDTGARMSVMQQAASSLTYGRRYALLNALGIVVGGEDDEGAGSSGRDRGIGAGAPVAVPARVAPTPVAAARPLGRNVVRIRPSQEPRDSDSPSSEGATPHASVAETPAAPGRDENDEAKAALRQGLIEDWMRLLCATGKFNDLGEAEMWDKATDVLSAQCEMQFKRPLHEMNLAALRDARRITDETLEKKGLNAA